MRKQQAPIIPEQKDATDTSSFVRLADKISEKDKESPFMLNIDPKAIPNIVMRYEKIIIYHFLASSKRIFKCSIRKFQFIKCCCFGVRKPQNG